MPGQVDNHDPTAKLELRRYFLNRYHVQNSDLKRAGKNAPVCTNANVFDCCQATGLLWRRLRREFKLAGYWGVDMKPKPGRLKIDSVRILEQPGWKQNVIDIDTYGSPWKHWSALLPAYRQTLNLEPRTENAAGLTVFLTIGQWQMGTDKKIIEALGLGQIARILPPGVAIKIHGVALGYLLGMAEDYKLQIVECQEIESDGSARYVGLHLRPLKNGGSSS